MSEEVLRGLGGKNRSSVDSVLHWPSEKIHFLIELLF
jgi:hypothetical protein